MYDWDEDNSDHVRAHGLEPEDVEEALSDPRRLGVAAYDTPTEERRAVLCATTSGRLLVVIVTHRSGLVRVVTARDADKRERQRYRRRGK